MIKKFTDLMIEKKEEIEKHYVRFFCLADEHGFYRKRLTYKNILIATLDFLQKYTVETIHDEKLETKKILKIDHGNNNGIEVFIIPTRDPSPHIYYYTYAKYGSCTACDIIEELIEKYTGLRSYSYDGYSVYTNYENEKEKRDNKLSEMKKDIYVLALHMLQKMKIMELI